MEMSNVIEEGRKERMKEGCTQHIICIVILCRTYGKGPLTDSDSERENPLPPYGLLFFD